MILVEGTRAFLEECNVLGDDIESFLDGETPHFRERNGSAYLRRMEAVRKWPDLPWPSFCSTCQEYLPRASFNLINNSNRCLFPSHCSRCDHARKVKKPSSLVVDPQLSEELKEGLVECCLFVDTKPYIVKISGLSKLGLDVNIVPKHELIQWSQSQWVKLRAARSLFGSDALLPQLCTGEGCKSINDDGVIKLQGSFCNTKEMTGVCKSCVSSRDAANHAIASAQRSSSRTRKCGKCGQLKAETSFAAGRSTCTSCKNARSEELGAQRADNTEGMRQCAGCKSRLVPDTPDTLQTCGFCRDKGARNDARPERKEARNALSRANGHKWSVAYRKRQREADPVGYLEHNAQRMREYNKANHERISEWRRTHPGTRISSLRKHQAELEARGMPLPPEGAISDLEIKALLEGECFYCGSSANADGGCLGIDRLDSDINYPFSNCVASCMACNLSKRRITPFIYVKRALWIAGYDTSDPSIWHEYRSPDWLSVAKRIQEVGGNLTRQQFEEIIRDPCTYCDRDVETGLDRIDNNEVYIDPNCTSCCGNCNFAKRDEDVDNFLARMEAIAHRHLENPHLLESVQMPTRVVRQYGIGDIIPEDLATASASTSRPPTSVQEAAIDSKMVLSMPQDNADFWESLQRWGEGKKTTVFVLVNAIRRYVNEPALDTLIEELGSNWRTVKTHPVSGLTFANMGTLSRKFPDLPWPKVCCGPCGEEKSVHAFPKGCHTCKSCGGNAARSAANRAKRSDAGSKAKEAARKRAQRASNQ